MAAAENHLRSHNENYSRIQQTAIEIIQRGKELNKIIDSCSFTVLIANEDGVIASGQHSGEDAVDGAQPNASTTGSQTASQRMKTILSYMQEEEKRFEELAELNRTHLEQTVHFNQFELDAKQVLNWMRNGESMLANTFVIPTSLHEAEELQIEHEQFQLAIEKTHASAYQLHQRADLLIQGKHMNSDSIASIKEQLDRRWQFLMAHAEDRHKLVIYGVNFYKTIQQVKLVLESLAKQYNSEEDFCRANSFNFNQFKSYDLLSLLTKVNTTTAGDEQSGEKKISQVISKHQEQKEAFLKACTLARRNAETFIKYANRCSNYNPGNQTLFRNAENRVKITLEQIHKEESLLIQFWTKRKRRLDHCQQFVLVE